jgi:hypothetical protein
VRAWDRRSCTGRLRLSSASFAVNRTDIRLCESVCKIQLTVGSVVWVLKKLWLHEIPAGTMLAAVLSSAKGLSNTFVAG